VAQLKEEIFAIAGTFAAVAIGALVVLALFMPFVFPVVVVVAVLAWYRVNRSKRLGTPRRPAGALKGCYQT
jgi:membrane protein implicated in regulation of membrane protease activity